MQKHAVISRTDAAANGATFFFTGLRCKRGHVAQRYVSTGNCVMCQREASAGASKAYRAKVLAKQRGQFTYPLHPDDHAAALAYCQALDMARGRQPWVPPPVDASPVVPRTAAELEAIRQRAFGSPAADTVAERDYTR